MIDRRFLGFTGEAAPETAPSQKQRAKRLDALRVACQQYVRDALLPELALALGRSPLERDRWRVTMDPDDVDAQTVLFTYPAEAASSDYIRPVVKIELGARSDTEPCVEPSITPYVAEALPAVCGDCGFTVRTVTPERTFWEKVALLHEEAHRAGDVPPKARLARHYYDVWALIQAGVAERAMENASLFARVAAHRAVFFHKSREAQVSLQPGTLAVVPSGSRRVAWRRDYEAMRGDVLRRAAVVRRHPRRGWRVRAEVQCEGGAAVTADLGVSRAPGPCGPAGALGVPRGQAAGRRRGVRADRGGGSTVTGGRPGNPCRPGPRAADARAPNTRRRPRAPRGR